MSITPEQFNRRSFVYPRLVAAGARFVGVGDAAAAAAFPDRPDPALGLVDLSPLPRTGIKGPRALSWLQERGLPVPARNNAAEQAEDGTLVCRLSDRELLILTAPARATRDQGRRILDLESAVPGEGVWTVPRADSHAWFSLRGPAAAECLQKLCGVDLREAHFPAGMIAQTSVARLNAVVCRVTASETSTFHILADSASALWFWDALLDAAEEFGGGPLGLREAGE